MSGTARSAVRRVRVAGGMTLLVYAVRTGAALLLAWPSLSALAPVLARHVDNARLDAADVGLVLQALIANGERQLWWAAGCLAGYLLLRPLLALAWLHALALPQPVSASLARAAGGYFRALALAGGAAIAAALGLGVLALALSPALAGLLPAAAWAEQACVLGCAGAGLVGALLIATTHDLTRVGLAGGLRLLPALRGALRGLSLGLLARHALLGASALLSVLLAELLARTAPELPAALLLLLQQACVLAAVVLRGLWLAYALAAVGAAAALADRDLDAERLA
jgi:hypothetical protein